MVSSRLSRSTVFFPLALLALLPSASARICYDGYGYEYQCSGFSNGARIGIGIGVAVLVLLIFSLATWTRRRRLRKAFLAQNAALTQIPQQVPQPSQYPPYNPNAQGYYYNPSQGGQNGKFAPPPGAPPRTESGVGTVGPSPGQYGGGVQSPQASYQPSASYNNNNAGGGYTGDLGETHGYEWQQAQENARLEAENAKAGGQHHGAASSFLNPAEGESAPPGYDVGGGSNHYAPPPGPPPQNNRQHSSTVV